ncbi:MAG: SoxR reducing system RseC family protein [Bacteroidaceae bacterium]|nr:SoxR reducing system RseC family protein [Bacteroidaceae bacterium]
MDNSIIHTGIVNDIQGTCVSVKIIQVSACATCGAKGLCSSSDSKEKMVDVTVSDTSPYKKGDEVELVGRTSMGLKAVGIAFVVPFLLLIVSLFAFIALLDNELVASALSLGIVAVFYFILSLNKSALKKQFSFTIKPIKK